MKAITISQSEALRIANGEQHTVFVVAPAQAVNFLAIHAWKFKGQPSQCVVAVATVLGTKWSSRRACALQLVLGDVRKLTEPVYCKGKLGLWDVDAALEAEIRRNMP